MKVKIFTMSLLLSVLFVCLFSASMIIVDNSETVYAMEQENIEIVPLSTSNNRSDDPILISGANNYKDPFVTAPFTDLKDVKYIPNANYFLINPLHRDNDGSDNSGGTCTTVAVQMLLGYHNYYSDRRIIPVSGNGRTFLDADYGNLELSPVFPRNRVSGQGCPKIGTMDGVYQEIFDRTWISEVPGIGQAVGLVKDGAVRFINEFTDPKAKDHISLTSGFFSKDEAYADIDAGIPIILGMDRLFQGVNFHVVLAYGYAKIDGVDGFLVHYGWGAGATQVWVPESWFGFQIRMSVEHSHTLVDSGRIVNNTHRQLNCTDCGYSTLDQLYNITDSTITSSRFPLFGNIIVPSSIEIYSQNTANFSTQAITNIGQSSFSDQRDLTEITIPSTITTIETNAFAACSNLSSINIPASITTIGDGVFTGCTNLSNINIPSTVINIGAGVFSGCNDLKINVSASNPNYSAEGNILYNKDKTKIISTGKTVSDLNILDSVTEIGEYAFAENSNLVSVRFSNTPTIAAYAFYHCPNMNSIYFDSYDVPKVGENSFSSNNFILYTRYNAQSAYQNIFSSYTNNIVSIPLQVKFISDGQVIETKTVYNGSTISNLTIPTKTGYEFNGWYPDDTYSGIPYQNGDLWESETDLYAYAKWTPKQYTVTLDADGGLLNGSPTFQVTYGNTYSTSAIVSRTGYTFEGWYDSEGVRCITSAGQGTTLWNKAEDTTLYAHWSVEKYEIQIKDDGNIIWLGANGLSDTRCTIEYGAILSAINLVPTFKASEYGFKEGKIFDHFEYNGTTMDWTSVPDLGEDGDVITIIPVWILEVHTIYFNTTCEIEVAEIVKEFDQPIDFPKVNRTGYTLIGWYTSISGNEPVTWKTMPDLTPTAQSNGSVMLYAKWEPITYTVVYNKNGGSGAMVSSSHTYNEPKNLSRNLYSKTGYDFKGWATTATGSVIYDDEQIVENLTTDNLSVITLYAVWKPKTYNIIYKNLTSEMLVYTTTYTYGEGLTTMPRVYISSGYHTTELENFYGWYTSDNFTSKVTSISKTRTGDITLFAKYDLWISTTYASYTNTVTDGSLNNQPNFSVDLLLGSYYYNEIKDTTLKKIKIEFSMNIWEQNDGYQDLYLFNGDTQIWKKTIEHGSGYKETTPSKYTFVIELDISDYRTVDWMELKFGAHGAFNDTWKIGRAHV